MYLSIERKHHLSVSHFFSYVFQCFAFQYTYLQVESYATSILLVSYYHVICCICAKHLDMEALFSLGLEFIFL